MLQNLLTLKKRSRQSKLKQGGALWLIASSIDASAQTAVPEETCKRICNASHPKKGNVAGHLASFALTRRAFRRSR